MKSIIVSSSKKNELIDITAQVKDIVRDSGVKNGICNIYMTHATGGIIINENYDPNVCTDFLNKINELIPDNAGYLHDKVDGNAGAHIKAAIIGPSETIPIKAGELNLGIWQAIMVADFDGPKKRTIFVSIIS